MVEHLTLLIQVPEDKLSALFKINSAVDGMELSQFPEHYQRSVITLEECTSGSS